ncbi:MAG: Uncharacterised protein [Alphaproteobacteria bacterium]|nr:MAG: Uncharacterised protein [Alphaproteobacteria bacterium]
MPFAFRSQRAQFGIFQRRQVNLKLGNLFGKLSRVQKRRTVFQFGARNIAQAVNGFFGARDPGNTRALIAEQKFGNGPPLILFTDKIFGRHTHIGQKHFIDFMAAINGDDRLHFNARCVHIDEQEGNAFLRLALAAGAHKAEHPIGMLRQSGPNLMAINDIFIAIQFGFGFQTGKVRTGTGL